MDHAGRRRALEGRLTDLEVDAFLVTRLVNVRYLTGFTGSNAQLILGLEGSLFLTDSRYEEQSRHEVPEVDHRIYTKGLADPVAEACRTMGIDTLGFEEAGVSYKTFRELEKKIDGTLRPLEDQVERLRWAKEAEEIRLVDRAQQITDDAFDRLVGKLAEGVTEREAAFELELAMRELGAERVGFDTIVAFGENAAEPHHHPTDRPLGRGDLIKLDFGCVVEGYHSDMTRTVFFGEPPGQLREVYNLVRRAHQAGIDSVRAGIRGGEADRAARQVIEEAGYGERFGHSLGHGVGLEIHEGPTLRADSDDELPEGAVVTVEPGVYLPGIGGVRIEDMVEVTAEGCRPMPRTTKDLVIL